MGHEGKNQLAYCWGKETPHTFTYPLLYAGQPIEFLVLKWIMKSRFMTWIKQSITSWRVFLKLYITECEVSTRDMTSV